MSTQKHENMTGQLGGFVAGLVVGGLSGAGAMLLLAPQSGRKTRTQIQKKALAVRKQTTEAVEDAMAQVRTKAQQITGDVKEQAADLQQRGQDVIDEQRDTVGEGLKDLERLFTPRRGVVEAGALGRLPIARTVGRAMGNLS